MGQPYVGEIRMFAGNFAPAGWALCQGQLMPISENETLFNLIGTTYGGDGQQTFQLPDLRSRMVIHQGGGFTIAETGGVENVSLTINQMPAHSHPVVVTNNNQSFSSPSQAFLAKGPQTYISNKAPDDHMGNVVMGAGGNVPHSNIQPYLTINFILSLFGIYPTPT